MKLINFLLCAIRIKLCSRSLPTQTKSAFAPQTKKEFGGTFLFLGESFLFLVELFFSLLNLFFSSLFFFFSSLKLYISSLNRVALSVPRCGLPRLNPGRRPAPTFELIFPARGSLLLPTPFFYYIVFCVTSRLRSYVGYWMTDWLSGLLLTSLMCPWWEMIPALTVSILYQYMFLCLCPLLLIAKKA